MIALCGCMMQEEKVVEKIKQSYRFVDLIFGTHNIFKFAELLVQSIENNKMVVDVWENTDQIVEQLPNERKFRFKSGVNIMFGCNNFCSYCIVPYVRGGSEAESRGRSSVKLKTLWRMVLWKLCCLDRMSILMERIWINQLLLHSFWSRLNRLRDWNGSGL